MELRINRAKQKLANGEIVTVIGGLTHADDIDGVGPLGLDGIWLEGEHGSSDAADMGNLTRACDLWGMTSLVRVNANEPGLIGRALDRGVQAVLVPHVNTKEEAERVVHGAKFAPVGMRGMGGSRQGLGVTDYVRTANDEIMVVILIEDIVAVNNLADILKVDGIDCLMVVPGDLSQSMGPEYLGRAEHPDVQAVIEKAMKQIIIAGRATGSTANDNNIERWMDAGGRMFLCNTQGYINNGLHGLRQTVDAKA